MLCNWKGIKNLEVVWLFLKNLNESEGLNGGDTTTLKSNVYLSIEHDSYGCYDSPYRIFVAYMRLSYYL